MTMQKYEVPRERLYTIEYDSPTKGWVLVYKADDVEVVLKECDDAVNEWAKDYFELQVTAMCLFDLLDRKPWPNSPMRQLFLDRIVPLDEVKPEDVDKVLDLLRQQAKVQP